MLTRRDFLRGPFRQNENRPRVTENSASSPPPPTPASEATTPSRPRIAQIGPDCLAQHHHICRLCGDACPERAIHFSPRLGQAALPMVNPDKCTACGKCLTPCPQNAIQIPQNTPETSAESSPK